VEAKNSWKAPDAKLLGAWLLRLAAVAVESLRVGQLLSFNEFLQAIVDVAI
jgi:hypothetical protein